MFSKSVGNWSNSPGEARKCGSYNCRIVWGEGRAEALSFEKDDSDKNVS